MKPLSAAGASGVEVVSIDALQRRLRRHTPSRRAQRPDFHLLLTVHQGVVWHMVDFRDYAVADGAWLWVRPGQVQRFGDLTTASGAVVMFPAGTLSSATAAGIALDDPFSPSLWTPTGDDRPALDQALGHLRTESEATDVPAGTRSVILHHLLTVLLLRLTNLTSTAGTPRPEHVSTYLRFRTAVEKNFVAHRDVAYYARSLSCSPRTLTRASIDAAGISAKEFIDRRVILEAKRLLAHGDEPVATVATQLGFDDTSNFVKYFALRARTTPAAFRQQYRGSGM